MPTFVIQTLGRPPHKVSSDKSPLRIGRDDDNDIVLPDETVSRSHAEVVRGLDGRWGVRCLSETNPVVVNGRLTPEKVVLSEGDEILVGGAFVMIFSENATEADRYVNADAAFQRSRCTGCDWEGLVSKLRANPTCPRCNGKEFVDVDPYAGEAKRTPSKSDSKAPRLQTAAVTPESAKKMMRAIRTANRSRLERLDGQGGEAGRVDLAEDKSVVLERSGDATTGLRGFAFGSISIAWNGQRYSAESAMIFPAMRVNGEKAKSADLFSGDVITVGSNTFKFVTE